MLQFSYTPAMTMRMHLEEYVLIHWSFIQGGPKK